MENERAYTRRKNCYFQNNSNIKICFPSIYNNCPKTYCQWTLKKIQTAFFLNNSSPKIKHKTLCSDSNNSSPKIKHKTLCSESKAGGLKNVDIPNKIIALQSSWIRRLYDNSFHEWKLIPLYLIEKSFGTLSKFH